jgi:DNA-binding MarR family transcriptional regulator
MKISATFHKLVHSTGMHKAEMEAGLNPLLHAAGAAQGYVESKLAAVGLSLPKLMTLAVLKDAGGSLPLGQLAAKLSCVKSNITQLVDRLEADGFVSRDADPSDRRSKLAVLSKAGRQACAEGTRIRRQAERDLFGEFSPEEQAALSTLMAKLVRRTG